MEQNAPDNNKNTFPKKSISVIPFVWIERQKIRQDSSFPEIWDLLDNVKDPEIPVLSLWDLGVLCNIGKSESDQLEITITPTYSGCPAIEVMQQDIKIALQNGGYQAPIFNIRLSPAWTTDWISPEGRDQLKAFGIAPPKSCNAADNATATPKKGIQCPICNSYETLLVSEFGSTACKALYKCTSCFEPFDYFKAI